MEFAPSISSKIFTHVLLICWEVISLKTQARSFKKVEKILRKQLGKTQAKTLLSRAVYLISVGTNDYRTFASDSKLFDSYSIEEYVDLVIGNLTSVIKVKQWISLCVEILISPVSNNTLLV